MTDRIEAYASFAKMMELGSFSAAGRQLGIAQSTVSKHIAALEAELGVQLFHRTTRQIRPTMEAARIHEHVQRMLEAVETAHAVVKGQQPEASGLLRIAVPPSLGRCLVLPLVHPFLEDHPLVSVELAVRDRVVDLAAEGFELAIVTDAPTEGPLITRTIRRFEWLVVASPGYLARYGTPETAIDLERHEVACTSWMLETPMAFDSENGRQAIRVGGRFRTDSDDAAYHAALSGRCIAVVPAWLAADGCENGNVAVLLRDYFLPSIAVSIIYPQSRYPSRRARAFIDYAAAHLVQSKDLLTRIDTSPAHPVSA
jgi:DNA-binding transcriptional LysR family regulator